METNKIIQINSFNCSARYFRFYWSRVCVYNIILGCSESPCLIHISPLASMLAGFWGYSIPYMLRYWGKVRLSSGLNLLQECIIAVSSVMLKVRMALYAHLNIKQMHLNSKDLLKDGLWAQCWSPLHRRKFHCPLSCIWHHFWSV